MVLKPLLVKITGDTAGLDRALDRAQKGLNSLASAVGKAAVAVTGGMTAMAVSGMSLAREIDTLAKVAGSTPRELQRMAAATKTVGLDMDKVSDILKDVNDRVGDFLTTGAGPMADFFEKIAPKVGVTAAQFRGLSGPQALQLYVDTLQKAGVNQQQMTFFMEGMASESTRLLPLLMNNGAEMRRFGDAAEAAGQIIEDSMIRRISDASKAIGQMGTAFDAFRLRLAAEVAPALELIAQRVATFMQSDAAQDAIERLTGAISAMLDVVGSETFLSGAVSAMTSLVSAVGAVADGFVWASQNIEAFTAGAAGVAITLAAIGGPVTLIGAAIAAVVTGLTVMSGRIKDNFGSLGNAVSMVGDVVREVFDRMQARASAWTTGLQSNIAGAQAKFFSLAETAASAISAATGAVASGVAAMINAAIAGIEAVINGAVMGLNLLVKGVNLLKPGADFELFDKFDAGRIDLDKATYAVDAMTESLSGLRAGAEESQTQLRGMSDQLSAMAGEPLSSVKALRDVLFPNQSGRSAGPGGVMTSDVSVAVPGLAPGMATMDFGAEGEGGEGGSSGSGGKSIQEQFAERFDALMQGMQTETEALNEWYTEGTQLLTDMLAQRLLTEEEYLEARTRMEAEYARRSNDIEKLRGDNNFQIVSKGLNEILGAAAQGNDKIMRAQKIFAAGTALIDTFQGAARELRKGTLGFASAAAVIAKGFGFVAAIKGTGSGGSGSSSATSAASNNVTNVTQQRTANISFVGGYAPTQDTIDMIANGLNDWLGDGGRLNIRGMA